MRKVGTALLRRIARALLEQLLSLRAYELGIHLVGAKEMALVNETFLGHSGSTDVITFDNSALAPTEPSPPLTGELFICLDDAVSQAREFRTAWQAEVVRYLVHGVLHLRGHDDLKPAARRKMKLEENRLLRLLARQFPLKRL
ncbi:MAG: rRNA maturation RNase YbeY [Verrucomicrobia bacterium]|nr:rRNA maturation RNase YbeY [Verrucomicrobiota bacterium]